MVHSAALLGDFGGKARFWDVNVFGTQRFLDAARKGSATKFVFIGSPSSLMDPQGGDQIGIDESTPYPRRYWNHYAETKAVAEQRVLAADCPDLRTCSLRPRAVWGPGDETGPIMRVLAKLRTGKLPDLARGKTVLASLCYIDSLADACLRALDAGPSSGKAYFIADAEPVDLWHAIGDLAQRFGLEPPAKQIPPLALNIGLAITETAWRVPWAARRWQPPLSRYALALLTRSAVYDTSAAQKDLGHRPVVD